MAYQNIGIQSEIYAYHLQNTAKCRQCSKPAQQDAAPGVNLNPLISPCNCTGARKYIHNECLKKNFFQIGKKIRNRDQELIFTYNSFQCSYCCEILTFQIKLKKKFNLDGVQFGIWVFLLFYPCLIVFSLGFACFYSTIIYQPSLMLHIWCRSCIVFLIIMLIISFWFAFIVFQPIVKVKQRKKKIMFNDQKICRLCLQPEDPSAIHESNSLIIPCKCQGTQKYIHEQCLKKWIILRKGYQIKYQTYFNSSDKTGKHSIECNSCKTKIAYELKNKIVIFNKQAMIFWLILCFAIAHGLVALLLLAYALFYISIFGQIWLGSLILLPYPVFWLVKYILFYLQYIVLSQMENEQHEKEQINFTAPT